MSTFNNPQYNTNINVTQVNPGNRSKQFAGNKVEDVFLGQFATVDNLLSRLTRNVKHKNFDKYDVAEWAAECEIEEIGQFESFQRFYGVGIKVKNNKLDLPCNVYRILSVYRNRCSVPNYEWDGAFLRFNYDDPRTFNDEYVVELDYLGVRVDDDGLPMILEGHQEACFWYCMTKIYFEDYANGKIPENRYMFFQERLGHYVTKAKGSMRHVSRDEMNILAFIANNLIPKVRMGRNV